MEHSLHAAMASIQNRTCLPPTTHPLTVTRQELERLRGELLALRERAGELAAIRDQLGQERRLTDSLQQRLAGTQQQLLEARQDAASRSVFKVEQSDSELRLICRFATVLALC